MDLRKQTPARATSHQRGTPGGDSAHTSFLQNKPNGIVRHRAIDLAGKRGATPLAGLVGRSHFSGTNPIEATANRHECSSIFTNVHLCSCEPRTPGAKRSQRGQRNRPRQTGGAAMQRRKRPEWDSNPRMPDLQSSPLVHLGIRPSASNVSGTVRFDQVSEGPWLPLRVFCSVIRWFLLPRVIQHTLRSFGRIRPTKSLHLNRPSRCRAGQSREKMS